MESCKENKTDSGGMREIEQMLGSGGMREIEQMSGGMRQTGRSNVATKWVRLGTHGTNLDQIT